MDFRKKKNVFVVLFFVFFLGNAQQKDWEKLKEQYDDYYLITDPNQEIELDTLVLFPPPKFKSYYDKRYYLWFKKKTYRAYPYAILAKEKMTILNDSVQKIKSKRKQKRYIKDQQKIFEKQFTENIKKLTRTEGRILIKLIHRLTGLTVNEHVQDKRGDFKAFWYRFSASFFKIDLDAEYHPEELMEDYMIESILQQAFTKGDLREEPSVLETANMVYPSRVIEIEKKK
ncbi:hypothetical protein FHR24_002220 [Wenyingzhuangia heitensis]|uniref:DUF4294 domain-containing protein n=1 Tax=Wenyingzhuangia heitensis TaxID=1487859 RepID=A0ABX0UAA5_9FLAO|nr:DUF4294 domain-containing protein [Wenyingzhuangia heitensis]NIJ45749.1 hypothetical protein [Wenyingzhuangia heitensis]